MNRLQELTRTLLDPEVAAETLRCEVLELGAILTAAQSGESRKQEGIADGETRTAEGLALSPTMAMMCADDYMRTIKFLRGAFDAIVDTRRKIRDRPVRVLYVGCGPLATLAVPLMSVLSPDEVTFTLLDIHERSIQAAREVVHSLGLAASVMAFEGTDASQYQWPTDRQPDLILMEIMQACLNSEPQVALTRHLLKQAPETVLIPEEIRVELMLVDLSREFSLDSGDGRAILVQRDRIPVATVFTLNRRAAKEWAGCLADRLPAAKVRLPERTEGDRQFMLFTVIHVYGNHVLRDYQSGLTCPRYFALDEGIRPGDLVQFHYALGSNPGLRVCKQPIADHFIAN